MEYRRECTAHGCPRSGTVAAYGAGPYDEGVSTTPIAIRAHMVLCLQGFRGEGYSVTFVSEMAGLLHQLAANPDQLVRLVTRPDRLCRACVNLRRGGCTLGGPEHEIHMHDQDVEVLRRLGLEEEGAYPWRVILERIGATVRGADLPGICTTCPWLELGYCTDAMDRLATAPAPQEID